MSSEKIDAALEALRQAISHAVREEQVRDQLTGLGNDLALTEWITTKIAEAKPFWIAFVEVDRFKEINDAFGYDNADTLLKKIAEHLRTAATYFSGGVTPFRAHGDEFYLAGPMPGRDDEAEEVGLALDHVRSSIGRMRVRVQGRDQPMRCTVSVGWTTEAKHGERGLRHDLEIATSTAKHRGRDRVVRYSEDLRKSEVVSVRSDCTCGATFSVTIPRRVLSLDDSLFCPHCGARLLRPPIAPPASTQVAPEI